MCFPIAGSTKDVPEGKVDSELWVIQYIAAFKCYTYCFKGVLFLGLVLGSSFLTFLFLSGRRLYRLP
jgi:hypothetical protein